MDCFLNTLARLAPRFRVLRLVWAYSVRQPQFDFHQPHTVKRGQPHNTRGIFDWFFAPTLAEHKLALDESEPMLDFRSDRGLQEFMPIDGLAQSIAPNDSPLGRFYRNMTSGFDGFGIFVYLKATLASITKDRSTFAVYQPVRMVNVMFARRCGF